MCVLTGAGVEAALASVCELLVDKYEYRTDMHDRDKLWLQGSGIHVHGSGEHYQKKGAADDVTVNAKMHLNDVYERTKRRRKGVVW